MTSRPHTTAFRDALADHLTGWGLRRFKSDGAYFQWQRETLSPHDLASLNRLVEEKRASGAGIASEVAFYDFTSRPNILPVLYSQRYDFYLAVGSAVAERLARAGSILDFGCGIGLLTTFYATQFQNSTCVGVDRSEASLAAARERAKALGLKNVRFECLDLERTPLAGAYDLIVSTHSILQAESDLGIPSQDWQTFERRKDPIAQADFEQRTGLKARLENLCRVLTPVGRLIAFEKTRQLARRVPFQRALSARGLRLLEPPLPIRYCVIEEVADDGPLYVLTRASSLMGKDFGLEWDEGPEHLEDEELYRCRAEAARVVWERLPSRVATRESKWVDPQLGSARAEWGVCGDTLAYLYLTVGDRFRGILVGSRRTGAELDRPLERELANIGTDSGRLSALLEATWPSSTGQEDPIYTPLYENHTASAQDVWAALPERQIAKASTSEEPDGRQKHVELGTTLGLTYLYWANTFDQRQLVIIDRQRLSLLEQYYQELLDSSGQGNR